MKNYGDEHTFTNVKGLPVGPGNRYFTERGWSQSYPWKEIARTAKTRTLAKVDVKPDPDWKPKILPGGFCGHCTNQNEQTWLYDKVDGARTVTVRATKRGWAHKGVVFVEGKAVEFYDYNF